MPACPNLEKQSAGQERLLYVSKLQNVIQYLKHKSFFYWYMQNIQRKKQNSDVDHLSL